MRPGRWAPGHCLGCSSQPPPKALARTATHRHPPPPTTAHARPTPTLRSRPEHALDTSLYSADDLSYDAAAGNPNRFPVIVCLEAGGPEAAADPQATACADTYTLGPSGSTRHLTLTLPLPLTLALGCTCQP